MRSLISEIFFFSDRRLNPALLEFAKIVRSADASPPDAKPEGAGLEAASLGLDRANFNKNYGRHLIV